MIDITPVFIIGSLAGVYVVGWSAGFILLSFKQLMEKI